MSEHEYKRVLDSARWSNIEFAAKQVLPAMKEVEYIHPVEGPGGYVLIYFTEADIRVASISRDGQLLWDRSV